VRRSPLLDCFAEGEFVLGEVAGMMLALQRRDDRKAATWMADQSHGAHCLWVGEGAARQLAAEGLESLRLFQRVAHPLGGWVVRLGAMRYLRAFTAPTVSPGALQADLLNLPLDSVDIALGGPEATKVLSEFCATQIERVTPDGWCPVTLAGHEVALWREGEIFHVVCAPADGLSVFRSLAAGLRDVDGVVIGLHDIPDRLQPGVQA
jgi:hypothetical protein